MTALLEYTPTVYCKANLFMPVYSEKLADFSIQQNKICPGADLGIFLRFPETGQVYSGNQNCILQ